MARGRRRRRRRIAMLINIVCHDQDSLAPRMHGELSKGARSCLQEPLGKVTENSALPG